MASSEGNFPVEQTNSVSLLLRPFLASVLHAYLQRNPTARRCMELIMEAEDGNPLVQDHFAFRTFGVDGCGIDSMAPLLESFGYTRRDLLHFPGKKLRAYWFAPPPEPPRTADQFVGGFIRWGGGDMVGEGEKAEWGEEGECGGKSVVEEVVTSGRETHGGGSLRGKGVAVSSSATALQWHGPLPRVFVSELCVEQMSCEVQAIVREYTRQAAVREHTRKAAAPPVAMHSVALCSSLGVLPWRLPCKEHYDILASESEYAAWVLLHGYSLNHSTISAHSLSSPRFLPSPSHRRIDSLNSFLQSHGVGFNTAGSLLKVSPDGLLLQSSTLADSATFLFADGQAASVAASYIEFAERLPLPQFAHLPEEQLQEHHRRDGFEVGSADRIFESTAGRQG